MGDRATYPGKGDTVECYYTGRLDSGKVFDTNVDDSMSTWSPHCCILSDKYIMDCHAVDMNFIFTERKFSPSVTVTTRLKTLSFYSPSYLSQLVTGTTDMPFGIPLRSASTHHYEPLTTWLKFGESHFLHAGLKACNTLPSQI